MADVVKRTALVVEDDEIQRTVAAMLLEDSDMNVFQCESGEAACLLLEKVGGCLCLIFTDVELAGSMTGGELASIAKRRFPELAVIVTSGRSAPPLPGGTMFLPKPWQSTDLLREAHAACRPSQGPASA